jgi:hypothetical protein
MVWYEQQISRCFTGTVHYDIATELITQDAKNEGGQGVVLLGGGDSFKSPEVLSPLPHATPTLDFRTSSIPTVRFRALSSSDEREQSVTRT